MITINFYGKKNNTIKIAFSQFNLDINGNNDNNNILLIY